MTGVLVSSIITCYLLVITGRVDLCFIFSICELELAAEENEENNTENSTENMALVAPKIAGTVMKHLSHS